jgi:NAD(P)-dependent dehydrogenase (short-subunit alcohol dehydrogenase family)
MKLSGRTAIITGATKGFGLAVAKEYIKKGASVVICGRNKNEVVNTITSLGYSAYGVVADVSIEEDTTRLINEAIHILGHVDILVNNAGVYGPKGPVEDIDPDEWIKAIQINLVGTFYMCRAILPHMKKNNYGKIINLSGGGATAPLPRISAYAASKAAVVRLTETLAQECEGYHIDINSVAPGALNTRLLDEVLSAGPEMVGQPFYEKALKQKQDGGTPLELGAELCAFLGSSESDGITGELISAVWDDWKHGQHTGKLRRVTT